MTKFRDVLRHIDVWCVAKRRQLRLTGFLAVGVVVAGCASAPRLTADTPAEVKRDAVAARAQARWDALIKADLPAAYQYLSPATRETMPLDVYKAKHKVDLYRDAKVDDVQCQIEACTVRLTVTYDYRRFQGVRTPLVEKWIISQGQAWLAE